MPLAIFTLILLVWTLVACLSAYSNHSQLKQNFHALARERGQSLFDLMEVTREWNARHGGIYAPVSSQNQPNPFLDVPKRDLKADGLDLTMVNPAYMTRQISELAQLRGGIAFHITSRKPIRPANAPDEWESMALKAFETDRTPFLEQVGSGESAQFRFMAPLIVKESCLNCHAAQAYKLGDVRGGISVTMPAAATLTAIEKETLRMLVQHGAAYVVISGLMVLLYLRAQAHIRTLDETARIQEDLVKTRTQELLEANAALGRSNAELEQFAYAVSHDLQEPLRMVASYVQLLGRRYQGKLDEDADAFIGYASDGAKRMQQMITDLLEFSRVQTKSDPFLPVAMDKALDLALGNLDLVLKETQSRIEADRASLPLVYGDKGQLSRLFQNLIGNAVKYRDPARAPHISIKAERQDGFWTFSVQDNGIGIEPQHFERIFRVFQRLHGRGTYEGNGIGLAICKKIVERHGGRIWVESKPGQGTCFYFTLPGYSGQIAKAGE